MLKLTTDKHEASRGLSATAELLVAYPICIRRPRQGSRLEYCRKVWCGKTRMLWFE